MDPDLVTDLGYEPSELEVVTVEERGCTQRLFLPADESDLHDDAFIIAGSDAVCNLADCI